MPPSHDALRAGNLQFKQFTKLLSESKRAFFEINAYAFQYIFYIWLLTGPVQVPPVMNFDRVIDKAITMVDHVLSNQAINNCADLQRALEARV